MPSAPIFVLHQNILQYPTDHSSAIRLLLILQIFISLFNRHQPPTANCFLLHQLSEQLLRLKKKPPPDDIRTSCSTRLEIPHLCTTLAQRVTCCGIKDLTLDPDRNAGSLCTFELIQFSFHQILKLYLQTDGRPSGETDRRASHNVFTVCTSCIKILQTYISVAFNVISVGAGKLQTRVLLHYTQFPFTSQLQTM